MTRWTRGIVLVGAMGAGKSSVGRRLEKRTGLPRVDTDELVEARFNLTVARIFEVHGEQAFRDAETAVLQEINRTHPSILVTGGGILLAPGNGELLRELGFVIYLKANEETLFQRASKRPTRPLLKRDNPREAMRQLLRIREPLFEKYADTTVDTSELDPGQVAEVVLREMQPQGQPESYGSATRSN